MSISFGLRRRVDDSEVVSAIALVLNSPANLLFLYQNSFFWPSAIKFEFYSIVVFVKLIKQINSKQLMLINLYCFKLRESSFTRLTLIGIFVIITAVYGYIKTLITGACLLHCVVM